MCHYEILLVFLLYVLPNVFCTCEGPYGNGWICLWSSYLSKSCTHELEICSRHLDNDHEKLYDGDEYCANNPNGMYF